MNRNYQISEDLQRMIGHENIVWSGKPHKTCFILECIFNPMLFFAGIWFFFDMFIIMGFLSNAEIRNQSGMSFIFVFFALHLMPVWIYLGGIVGCIRRYKNTEYAITDRGIYVTGGLISKHYDFKPFTDLSHVNVHRGFLDQRLGVGDVISSCHHSRGSHNHNTSNFSLNDLPDYIEVCNLIKQYQTDIYADTQFPNMYRPDMNVGYQTSYRPGMSIPNNQNFNNLMNQRMTNINGSVSPNPYGLPKNTVENMYNNRVLNNTYNTPAYNNNNNTYNNNAYNNNPYSNNPDINRFKDFDNNIGNEDFNEWKDL